MISANPLTDWQEAESTKGPTLMLSKYKFHCTLAVAFSMFPQLIISRAFAVWGSGSVAFLLAFCFPLFGSGQSARLIFADEFDGAEDAAFDSKLWTGEIGGGGWGNQELQYYTVDRKNVRLDGKGNLEIRAVELPAETTLNCWYGKCRYASARLITKGKFQFTYGRAESRISLPEGTGVWPAFWMLGSDVDQKGWPLSGEIDIMEFIGREPTSIFGTLHGPGYSGEKSIGNSTFVRGKQRTGARFHIFAVEWEPTEIRWYVDEKLYHKVTPKDLPAGTKWVFDKPFFLILNFAVGGNLPGSPDTKTRFPQTMLVDYVRVTSARPMN